LEDLESSVASSTDVTVCVKHDLLYTSATNRTQAYDCITDSVVQRLTVPPNDSSDLIVQASTNTNTLTSTVQSSDGSLKSHSEGSLHKLKENKMFPLLQITSATAVNKRGISQEFPGLMKNLQTFNNAMQQYDHRPIFSVPNVDQCNLTTIPAPPYVSAPHNSEALKQIKYAPITLPLLRLPQNTKVDNVEPKKQFSFIPFKPFVPKLFKPGRANNCGKAQRSLPLLQCEDQNSRYAFPLFSVNNTERTVKPPPSVNGHCTSSQMDSVSTVSVCASVPSVVDKSHKRHHKRSRKCKSGKVSHIKDTTCDDASRPFLLNHKEHSISDKAVQVNSSLTNTNTPRSSPILIQRHSLEMSRIEIKEAQKHLQLQDTAKADICVANNYNYQISSRNMYVSGPVTTVGATSSVSLTNPRATTSKAVANTTSTTTEVSTGSTVTTSSTSLTDSSATTGTVTINTVPSVAGTIAAAMGLNDTITTSVGDKQVFLDVVDIEGGSSNDSIENNVPSSQEDMKLFLSHMDHEGDTSAVMEHQKNTLGSTSGMFLCIFYKLINFLCISFS